LSQPVTHLRLTVPPGVPLAPQPPAPALRRLPRRHLRALTRPQRPVAHRAPLGRAPVGARPPRRGLAARGTGAL